MVSGGQEPGRKSLGRGADLRPIDHRQQQAHSNQRSQAPYDPHNGTDDCTSAFRAWEYWGFSWKPKCNSQFRYVGRMVPGSAGWNVTVVVGGRWALGQHRDRVISSLAPVRLIPSSIWGIRTRESTKRSSIFPNPSPGTAIWRPSVARLR